MVRAIRFIVLLPFALCLAQAADAQAAGWTTLPAASAPHTSLSLPMFAGDEYSYNPVAPSQPIHQHNNWEGTDTAATAVLAQTHGFISAGIGTGGGHDLAAGVTIPLVPGKLDLSVAGQTGQFRGLTGWTPAGPQLGLLSYNQYNVALAYHPTEDFGAVLAITGGHIGSL